MSDSNEAQSFATAGSGKSEAEVAFDLLNKLKGQGVWGERNVSAILDMYAECLDATKGLRAYECQNRVEAPTKQGTPVATAQPRQPTVQPQAAAQPVAPRPTAQPVQHAQAVPAQPVHAQQQQLQQAFKQG